VLAGVDILGLPQIGSRCGRARIVGTGGHYVRRQTVPVHRPIKVIVNTLCFICTVT